MGYSAKLKKFIVFPHRGQCFPQLILQVCPETAQQTP
jgi:hypothetical protein